MGVIKACHYMGSQIVTVPLNLFEMIMELGWRRSCSALQSGILLLWIRNQPVNVSEVCQLLWEGWADSRQNDT